MKTLSGVFILVLLLSIPALADYSEIRNLKIPIGDIKEFEIDCGAGFLEIEGVEGLTSIEVEAEIVIENMRQKKAEEYVEDYLKLNLNDNGKYARLNSTFENNKSSWFSSWNNVSASINLTIRVPKNLDFEIDDGSGYISIVNTNGDLEMDDGSGDIFLENIKGFIRIDDGSGELDLKNITGKVDIDDGSGEIHAKKIEGDLIIDDGSGEITATDIIGDIDIDDGSGDIRVRQIDGSVVVDDGSGNIRINYVTHDVEIKGNSSGRLSIANVDGDVYGDDDDEHDHYHH